MENFGPGTGNVYLKNLNCTGQEWMVDQCSSVNWWPSDCPHSLDVGIKCMFKFESGKGQYAY